MQQFAAAYKRRTCVTSEHKRQTLARIVGLLQEDAERYKQQQEATQAR